MIEAQKLGASLQDWRILLGLTQELVAQRAGISRSTLIKLEQGAGAKLETFLTVAKVLGIADRVQEAVEPLNTDLGRARSRLLGRQRVSKAG
ncbi:transcriptional regulator with XRE-family HTH domain [Neomicrococcus aestuarii]|uniref:Transcriptional regulator with XRE-family HTH domain n=1 Tax=Neomicrococcus aestuarii TaxID=556325 RepID=A0A7W8TTE7_9MICC|nr:helix-turn-helix transcriptional regulator [Neomicrococcus aestuarii]MBB5512595.1 transcriptional regulator with XRE-family HTH domain [Neomicrococcus aestuarii]